MACWKRSEWSCGASCQQGHDCEKRQNSRNQHGFSVFVSFHFPAQGTERAHCLNGRHDAGARAWLPKWAIRRNEEERALAGFDSKSATQNLTHLAAARCRRRNQWPKLALLPKLRLARLATMQAAVRAIEQPARQLRWERVQPMPCNIAWRDREAEMPLYRNGSRHAPLQDFRLRPGRNGLRQKATPRRPS